MRIIDWKIKVIYFLIVYYDYKLLMKLMILEKFKMNFLKKDLIG